MDLHLQEYNFTIVYTKGFENPSDFLSRHPSIKQATKDDVTLQKLIEFMSTNDWKLTELSNQDADIQELKH